jgi:predicted AAA+ superfamily ATPase
LELLVGRPIDFENTVLFFDEVQESEELISALKYFAEAKVGYKIICAGSLLGVKINRFKKPFPVGKVEMIHMGPMDMEEFLEANGQTGLIDEIKKCFREDVSMSEPLHEKCLTYLRVYLCSGGMPEAVSEMISHDNSVLTFNTKILEDIWQSYLNDMNKYITSTAESAKIEAIYRSIPAQLGNNSGKFQYAVVTKGARNRDYSSALDWLTSSNMIHRCEAVTSPEMPLKGYIKDGYFKLFLNDTGILCNMLGIRLSEVMLDHDYHYKGIIIENYVACQLAAARIPLFYWRSENTSEVDFLIDTVSGIVPIEAKAGKNKGSASLEVYRKRFSPPYSIRLTARNFGFTNKIKSVPLYAAFCLDQLL